MPVTGHSSLCFFLSRYSVLSDLPDARYTCRLLMLRAGASKLVKDVLATSLGTCTYEEKECRVRVFLLSYLQAILLHTPTPEHGEFQHRRSMGR